MNRIKYPKYEGKLIIFFLNTVNPKMHSILVYVLVNIAPKNSHCFLLGLVHKVCLKGNKEKLVSHTNKFSSDFSRRLSVVRYMWPDVMDSRASLSQLLAPELRLVIQDSFYISKVCKTFLPAWKDSTMPGSSESTSVCGSKNCSRCRNAVGLDTCHKIKTKKKIYKTSMKYVLY